MEAEKGKSWNGLAVALVLTIVMPVLYVGSIGPMAWLAANDMIGENAFIVYLPLGLLCSLSDSLDEMLQAYIDLWTS